MLFSINAFALYTQNIPNACGMVQYSRISAFFKPNTYTCSNGYFLPANTDGCQPCPIDHICNGGTFTFNELQSQGIVYKTLTRNATKACASNINHVLVALFEPNTVTLNYDNGDGTTTTGTCTYDNLITLPETTPTKPGYTFTGWKVQRPNNNN